MATRMDLARLVAEKEDNLTIQSANSIIGTTIEVIGERLRKGEDVQLVGLGTFKVATRKARQGRNPKTGEPIDIPEKKVVRFKPSKGLNPPAPKARAQSAGKGAKKRGEKSR